VFAAFSDGLTEAMAPDGDELGTKGLIDIIRGHARLTPRGLVDATLADVREFSGSAPPTDDRTLVIARLQEAR
jgi:serine phosphatase RsbU (regulator of sigma subunit)